MGKKTYYDVLVVGAGPGGSIAAKICAGAGLKTLLLENKKLPRDKVCTGMIMGYWAKNFLRDHFGDIPADVLADPGYYAGIVLHVGAKISVLVPHQIPVGWRRELDCWMCQKVTETGAELRDGTRVNFAAGHKTGYSVEIRKENGQLDHIYARFVIGADGALSVVRRFVQPDLKVHYRPAYRECYQEDLSIQKDYFHWFFPAASASPRFDVNYKDGFFLIEGGNIRRIKDNIRQIMKDYGLARGAEPVWRDGCVIPELYDDWLKGSFSPARNNVLLVGDAAGMLLPFTHEGIGSALKSGALAAEAVIEAHSRRKKADQLYIRKIEGMRLLFGELRGMHLKMGIIAEQGADALSEAMTEYIEKTLGNSNSKSTLYHRG